MTRATCETCGGTVLYEVGQEPRAATTICPRCSSAVPLSAAQDSQGQLSAAGGTRIALDPYRTGTIVLDSDEPSQPAVEVKVKGFLTQEGLPPEEADYRLRGETTVVGRREGQVILDDPAVSARHFQVDELSGRFFVRDLGSSNGTFLNGRMVRSAQLCSGDRILAGTTIFTFSVRHTIPT